MTGPFITPLDFGAEIFFGYIKKSLDRGKIPDILFYNSYRNSRIKDAIFGQK